MPHLNIIPESDFRKQIKSAKPCGYFFFGEEDYLKNIALKTARDAVCPDAALAPFNNIRLEGLHLTPDSLLDAIVTLPMMSDLKLIEIVGVDFKPLKASDVDEYCKVFAMLEEYDYNILILSVSSGAMDAGNPPKKPSQLFKKLSSVLTPVSFAASTPLMLSRWVGKHFAANGVSADAAVCASVVDYCGTDMFRLAYETDKLSWYTLSCGKERVEQKDIVKVLIPDNTYDTFALTNAVMDNNKTEALRVLSEMIKRRIDPPVIMGDIISVFCDMLNARLLSDEGMSPAEIASKMSSYKSSITRIHEFRVKLCLRSGARPDRIKRALQLCMETDNALKQNFGADYSVIERLVCAL